MSLSPGSAAPDFCLASPQGPLRLREHARGRWLVLFVQPPAFTPVCATELVALARRRAAFEMRGIRLAVVAGVAPEECRRRLAEIADLANAEISFPVLGDPGQVVARRYGLPQAALAPRAVFVIDRAGVVQAALACPATIGSNLDEVLRLADALQLAERSRLATPADWQPGAEAIIAASVPDAEAARLYPGFRAVTPYLRYAAVRP